MNRLFNANGVPPSSPGLRGTRYPGTTFPPHDPTATRLRPVRRRTHEPGRNRVAVRFIFGTRSQGRPHCIRPTLGWRTQARWANEFQHQRHFIMSVAPVSLPRRHFGPPIIRISQRQRRSALQPRVARHALPWGPHCIRPTLGWRAEARWANGIFVRESFDQLTHASITLRRLYSCGLFHQGEAAISIGS